MVSAGSAVLSPHAARKISAWERKGRPFCCSVLWMLPCVPGGPPGAGPRKREIAVGGFGSEVGRAFGFWSRGGAIPDSRVRGSPVLGMGLSHCDHLLIDFSIERRFKKWSVLCQCGLLWCWLEMESRVHPPSCTSMKLTRTMLECASEKWSIGQCCLFWEPLDQPQQVAQAVRGRKHATPANFRYLRQITGARPRAGAAHSCFCFMFDEVALWLDAGMCLLLGPPRRLAVALR